MNARERGQMQKEYKFLKNCRRDDSNIRSSFNNRWGYDMTGEFFRELKDKLTTPPWELDPLVMVNTNHSVGVVTPEMLASVVDYVLTPKRDHKGSTTRAIKPPPEHFIVQFIGGPINGEQHFKPYKEYFPILKQGGIFTWADPVTLNPMPLPVGTPAYLDTARYKLTFIPQSETPFSDDQIVIAIFQPDNS